MMKDAILNFAKQFDYEPVVEGGRLKTHKQYVLVGMGGSHLNGDLILTCNPDFPLTVWRDYGLPPMDESELKHSLIICSSYSGNTEEVIEAFRQAHRKRLSIVCIAVGGTLLDLARKHGYPYVQLPDTGIQPRAALGLSYRALLKILGDEGTLKKTKRLGKTLDPKALEKAGRALAKKMKDKVPVIYCSRANETVAWNWKIKFNETGKIPAFYNVLPELNHNEMTGFDVTPASAHLSNRFHFIFITDTRDHRQIQKRMAIMKKLYTDRALPVTVLPLEGKDIFEKIFTSLVIADWAAESTAALYGLESEQVPMVEEFKRMI